MTHTKSTRYIARNDYAAVVDGIDIGFSDTAFGAEIICNDYVTAQIAFATRAADGAEGATAMNTYTIQTTGENLANNYSGFGEWEYKGRSNRVTTETYTVTIPTGQMAAFEQLLDTDDSVLSYATDED